METRREQKGEEKERGEDARIGERRKERRGRIIENKGKGEERRWYREAERRCYREEKGRERD